MDFLSTTLQNIDRKEVLGYYEIIRNPKGSAMKKLLKVLTAALCAVLIVIIGANAFVMIYSSPYIVSEDELGGEYDFIAVLGSTVYAGEPKPILRDRLDKAIELYDENVCGVLLMTGDGSDYYYNEVNVMKNYAEERGVKPTDIICDSEGLSTYASAYNAKNIYNADRIIIITQKYHVYRAVFLARRMGIKAYGVACDSENANYGYVFYRHSREIVARVKDLLFSIAKPDPKSIPDF